MANEAIRRSIEIHNKGSISTNVSPKKEKLHCAGCTYWEEKYNESRRSHEKSIEALQNIEKGARDALKKAETSG